MWRRIPTNTTTSAPQRNTHTRRTTPKHKNKHTKSKKAHTHAHTKARKGTHMRKHAHTHATKHKRADRITLILLALFTLGQPLSALMRLTATSFSAKPELEATSGTQLLECGTIFPTVREGTVYQSSRWKQPGHNSL